MKTVEIRGRDLWKRKLWSKETETETETETEGKSVSVRLKAQNDDRAEWDDQTKKWRKELSD